MTRRSFRSVRAAAATALVTLLAVAMTSGCGERGARLLRKFRVIEPQRQIGQAAWLADFTTEEVGGRLSPGGMQLIYAGNQKGSMDIWLRNLSTGELRRITRHVATDTQPSWHPDGKRVVFVSMREDAKGDVYLWEGGSSFTRLSDRTTADAYPVFSPDGRTLYWAAGPEGQSRIVSLALDDKGARPSPLTGWGATHPAVSPDGRYLAYTQFDGQGRGRIAVMRLADKKTYIVTPPDHHGGFPTFSPDGKTLLFCWFRREHAGAALTPDSVASLWRLQLQPALAAAGDPSGAMRFARPLTSDRSTVIFAQAHRRGIVFTAPHTGSLDIGIMPSGGLVPRLSNTADQLRLALQQDDPWDELLCLERVAARDRGEVGARARYRSATLLRELGHTGESATLLRTLVGNNASAELAALAAIDLQLLPVREKPSPKLARSLLKQLLAASQTKTKSERVTAYRLLRIAELRQLAGDTSAAVVGFEELLARYPQQRQIGVQASLRLGALLSRLRAPDLLADYYLALFDAYPKQRRWLRRAAASALDLFAKLPAEAQIEKLRALIDRHGNRALPVAMALRRIAKLHEQRARLDLAIEANHLVTKNHRALLKQSTAAAFELGRLCLAYSKQLRRTGKLSEALVYYTKARRAYEWVVKAHEPSAEAHQRAHREYVRLSMLEALQLERDGESVMATKRYEQIIAFDAEVLQAHRRLITLEVAAGHLEQLESRYRRRLDDDSEDFVANYALGYLKTFAKPLDAGDLDDAAKQLEHATSLRPQSPFGHMTLGWVFEMRERHLGEARKGWLEEAIDRYDRAYELNDRNLDSQTEADLLVNLANAFANLGNGWRQAYDFASKRDTLKLPFLSAQRELTFRLVYGRAATATGSYRVASRQLEQALALARRQALPRLESEALARLALAANLRGQYDESTQLLRSAMALLAKAGRQEMLAPMTRTVAYNLLLSGKPEQAQKELEQAAKHLAEHGAPTPLPSSLIGGAGRSVAPFGFDAADERDAQRALLGILHERHHRWDRARAELLARIKDRLAALAEKEDAERQLELQQLRNRLALIERQVGKHGSADKLLSDAIALLDELQKKEGPFEPDTYLFPLQVGLALNLAEAALQRSLRGDPGADKALRNAHALLARLESLRLAAVEELEKPLLAERLRLSLQNDLATLSLAIGLADIASPPPGKKAGDKRELILRHLQRGERLVEAARLLRQVASATAPPPVPTDRRALTAAITKAKERDAVAPLYMPLRPTERMRWHILATLNLAHVTTILLPSEQLQKHPSTEAIANLARLGLKHDLGSLRFVIAAELAWRRRDARGMRAAVDGFLARGPFQLSSADHGSAGLFRRLIMSRAIALAVAEKDHPTAIGYAEQWERCAFVDDLVDLQPRALGSAAPLLSRLLRAGREHRRLLDRQEIVWRAQPTTDSAPTTPKPNTETEAATKGWQEAVARSERAIAEARKKLQQVVPNVGSLLRVDPFPWKQLQAAMAEDDLLVTTVIDGTEALVYGIKRGGGSSPQVTLLLRQTRQALREKSGVAKLRAVLGKLTSSARRIYLDLGRIDATRSWPALLGKREVVSLSGLWQLVDARAKQSPPRAGGIVVAPAKFAKQLGEQLSLPVLAAAPTGSALARQLEEAGALLWAAPVRSVGGSSANIQLERPGTEPLHLARHLGMPLRGQLMLLGEVHLTPGHERAERVALSRMLHAAGIEALIVDEKLAAGDGKRAARLLSALKAERTSAAAITARLPLYGDGGISPAAKKALVSKQLPERLAAGKAASKKGQLAQAIDDLRYALAAMRYLGKLEKEDDGLDALGRAYTFAEDYGRAVAQMERLLALRRARVNKALSAGGRQLLIARASLVKALTSMGWIRLRNEQYKEALEVNAQAIEVYNAVKRPLLAADAYEQRSIIAAKKGDANEALGAAKKLLEINRKKLARTKQSAKGFDAKRANAQLELAKAANRVARLQRVRFSAYRDAKHHANDARAQLAWAAPERLGQLRTAYGEAKKRAGKSAEAKKQLAARLKAIMLEGRVLRSALIARVDTQLEIARIHSAQGDYGGAVAQARQALLLADSAGLTAQKDTATLEVVNNLYYTGAYREAMQTADAALLRTKNNQLRQIQFYNVKGTIHAVLGQHARAHKALDKALHIAERIDNPIEIAASHNNLGNALLRAGQYQQALESFNSALRIDRRREDKLGMSFDHFNLGLTAVLMGRHKEGRQQLQEAISFSQEIGAPLNEIKARLQLGRLDLAQKKLGPAQKQLEQGLRLARSLGLRNWLWRLQLWTARLQRRRGKPAAARALLREALQIVEQQPPRLRPVIGTKSHEADPDDVYDELIDLHAMRDDSRAAFDLSERLRGRRFVDLISKSVLKLPLGEKAAVMREVVDAQISLEAARGAAMRAKTASAKKATAAEVARLKASIAGSRAKLGQGQQALPSLVSVDVWPHKKLAALLRARPATTFVSFYAGRKRLIVWLLRGERLQMVAVSVTRAALTALVEQFRNRLVRFHDVKPLAQQLYRHLFGKLRLRKGQRLVVIPAGPLHLLPFAALRDGDHDLVERHTISYLPSVNALRRQPSTATQPKKTAAAADARRRVSFALAASGSTELPFIPREARAFVSTFEKSARSFVGEDATIDRFVAEAPEADLLHVATHATFDPDAPLRSHLALDNPLELRRIFGLQLRAELVILSACETGLGPLAGADGILGLHRAFQVAGARRVVSSLFRVSDLGTALMMKHFFRQLRAGSTPAEALQKAQQKVRSRFAHPAFWAGFRLDG